MQTFFSFLVKVAQSHVGVCPNISYKTFHTVTILMWKVSQKGPFYSSSAMAVADWPGKATWSSRIGTQAMALASKDG